MRKQKDIFANEVSTSIGVMHRIGVETSLYIFLYIEKRFPKCQLRKNAKSAIAGRPCEIC